MLPLPVLAGPISDVSGTVAIVEGLNDNVVQTTDQNNNIQRHPALFTGVDTGVELRLTEPDADVHGLRLRVRGQFYEPLSSQSADPDGTVQASWQSSITLGKHTSMNFGLSSTLSAITSARVGDGTLFYTVDPSTTQTTFTVSQGALGITQDIDSRWRFRVSGGFLLTTTVSAPPFQVADRQILDRRGVDGEQPFGTLSLLHDFSARDTGDISVSYRYTYAPYSLDFTTTPPRLGGPQNIHQVIPDLGLSHAFSPEWVAITRAGVSVSSPPYFDPDRKAVFYPSLSEELHYTSERWAFLGQGAFSYGSVTPRLGAGPGYGGTAILSGYPFLGHWKRLVGILTAQASHAAVVGIGGSTTNLNIAGLSVQARYPLSRYVGLLTGYDVRYSTLGAEGAPATPYFRQILFVGFSGYWATDENIPPLQLLSAPFKPG